MAMVLFVGLPLDHDLAPLAFEEEEPIVHDLALNFAAGRSSL